LIRKKIILLFLSGIIFPWNIFAQGDTVYQKQTLQVSVKANIYGKDDKLRISGEYWIKDMPDNYWGVGYTNGRERPKSEDITGYHRYWRQFKFKIAYRIFPNIYLGVNYRKE